jgi:hypothetical protein
VIAVAYVEARARVEGFDLRAALASIETAHAPRASRAALWLALGILVVPANVAAVPPPIADAAEEASPGETVLVDDPAWARDEETERLAASVLEDPVFDDPLANRGRGVAEAFARWLESLHLDEDETHASPASGLSFAIPRVFFYLAIAVLLVGIVAWIASAAGAPRVVENEGENTPRSVDPRDLAPSTHLEAAASLAASGDYRGALRALYVATLVALDRRAVIDFQPWRTNGHYVRTMPAGDGRESLHRLTGLFDRTWYGDEPAGENEYREGRALAEAMCSEEPRS